MPRSFTGEILASAMNNSVSSDWLVSRSQGVKPPNLKEMGANLTVASPPAMSAPPKKIPRYGSLTLWSPTVRSKPVSGTLNQR